jgi:cyclic di-GMP phosphodiesterase Gmr
MALAISQAIDVFVTRGVLAALRSWQHEGVELQVHVNITNTDEHVCTELERILQESAPLARRVAIEIGATAAFADPERVAAFVQRLRRFGVSVGLDGFAAEPVAFDALAALPLDFVKIGRAVTERAWHDERWKRLARGSIALAQALEVRVLADGVQNGEQARWLAENGVGAMQGYVFAQPMTAPDFAEWVRAADAEAEDAVASLAFLSRAASREAALRTT